MDSCSNSLEHIDNIRTKDKTWLKDSETTSQIKGALSQAFMHESSFIKNGREEKTFQVEQRYKNDVSRALVSRPVQFKHSV